MAGESAIYKKFRAEQDAADAAYKSWEKDQWAKNGAEWTKQGYTRTDAPNNTWGSTWAPKLKIELEIEEKEDPTKAWYDHMKTLGYKEEALSDGTKRFTHNNNLYYSNGRAQVDGKMIDYDYKTLTKAETPKLNPKSFDLEAFRKNEGITSSNYINHAGNQYLRYDPDGSGDFYVGTDGSIYQANWFGGGLGDKLDHAVVNRDLRGTYLSNYNNLYNLISNFNVPTNKQGGTMNKVKYFSQGGAPTLEQIDPEMQAKADDLVLKAMQGDTNSQNSVKAIIDAAKKQDAKALQLLPYIQRAMEKAKSQAASAKWGSKLQYIKSLKFAKGGKNCPACMAAGGQTKEKSNTYIAPSDTVHVQGKPKSLVDSQGKKTVKHLPEYTASDYQKDLKDAKKGKKDAAKRVEKQDMKTAYGCGGKAGKAKKHQEGGLMELLPFYGTYQSGKRFFENPSWKGAGEFGIDLAGDALLLTGAGAGAGMAMKAAKTAKAANLISKTAKTRDAYKAARTASYLKPTGGYFDEAVNSGRMLLGNEAKKDLATGYYDLSRTLPMDAANTWAASKMVKAPYLLNLE